MLCQRLKSCTPNICLQKRQIYYFYHVHFPHFLFGFVLFYYLQLSSCCLLVHFPFIVWVFDFLISVNIFLQQSTCIVFISHIVGLALSYCCLLFLYLFISLIVVWVFDFFVFINIFLQQSIFFQYKYQVIILRCFSHNSWVFLDNVSKFSICYLQTSKCTERNLAKK